MDRSIKLVEDQEHKAKLYVGPRRQTRSGEECMKWMHSSTDSVCILGHTDSFALCSWLSTSVIDLSFALSSLSLSKFTRRSNGLPTKVKGAKQTLNDLKDLYDFSRRRPTKAKGFRIEFSVFGFNTFKEVPP